MSNASFMNYGGAMGFGGVSERMPTLFAPGKRRRINLLAICLNVFIPFFMFAAIYCSMSFRSHYQNPGMCWLMVFLLLLICLFVAFWAMRERSTFGETRDP